MLRFGSWMDTFFFGYDSSKSKGGGRPLLANYIARITSSLLMKESIYYDIG